MRPLETITPAVTCSVQATFMTGLLPREHGIVANGWLFRDLWRSGSGGSRTGSSTARRSGRRGSGAIRPSPAPTCSGGTTWPASFEIGATPRPIYKADGRKLPDCYTKPAGLRDALTEKLGPFPLFQFWGPGTTIASTRWIAEAAGHVIGAHRPTLTLVYLPHLDYDMQRHGPDPSASGGGAVAPRPRRGRGRLIAAAEAEGLNILVLSEYGITPVDTPVHLNRVSATPASSPCARRTGPRCSTRSPRAPSRSRPPDRACLRRRPGLGAAGAAALRDLAGRRRGARRGGQAGARPRSSPLGRARPLAKPNAWFTYYYWQDDARAPDFARTVEIHRKPGYDPVELFLDPAILSEARDRRAAREARPRLSRPMDVIPLDAPW